MEYLLNSIFSFAYNVNIANTQQQVSLHFPVANDHCCVSYFDSQG